MNEWMKQGALVDKRKASLASWWSRAVGLLLDRGLLLYFCPTIWIGTRLLVLVQPPEWICWITHLLVRFQVLPGTGVLYYLLCLVYWSTTNWYCFMKCHTTSFLAVVGCSVRASWPNLDTGRFTNVSPQTLATSNHTWFVRTSKCIEFVQHIDNRVYASYTSPLHGSIMMTTLYSEY